jgi:hypothetical protein
MISSLGNRHFLVNHSCKSRSLGEGAKRHKVFKSLSVVQETDTLAIKFLFMEWSRLTDLPESKDDRLQINNHKQMLWTQKRCDLKRVVYINLLEKVHQVQVGFVQTWCPCMSSMREKDDNHKLQSVQLHISFPIQYHTKLWYRLDNTFVSFILIFEITCRNN